MVFMKRFFARIGLILLSLMTFIFVSCDGDDYPSEGYFQVGETTYITNEARLNDVGYDAESGLYQLRLTMDNTSHNDFHSINVLFYSEARFFFQAFAQSSPAATLAPKPVKVSLSLNIITLGATAAHC